MYNEDDDPVVDEIPVFLCHDLEEKLFIFQYPIHPATASSSNLNIVKSQIKPDNQEVVLEVGLDTQSPNYDKSHGEQIALSIDKDKANSAKTFPLKYVDRLKLESKKAEVDLESYAIGAMVHGSLVLSSVKGAVCLSPSLPHLVSGAEENEATAGEEEAKMVRVQFSKVETEKSKKARQQSYSYYCQKSAEEPWCHTEYHGPGSALSQVERQRLAGALGEGRTLLSSVDYLDCLVKTGEQTCAVTDAETLSNKVTDLLKRVRAIKTSVAADALSVREAEVLPCLQKSGVLVQGLWVLRSDLKFAGGHCAVPQEQLMKARDYVLLQFSDGRVIERSKLGDIVRLPPDVLLDILSEVGKLNSNKAWVFSHMPDRQFIARYPEIVEQQGLLWEARTAQILEGIGGRRRRRDSSRKNRGNSLSEDDCDTTKRSRKKSECDIKPDIATLAGLNS